MHDGDSLEEGRSVLIGDKEGEGHGMKTGHGSQYSHKHAGIHKL